MLEWSPVLRVQETTAPILVLHTIAALTNGWIGVVLFRALLVLRRGGERPPGFVLVALMVMAASAMRALWLAVIWLSLTPPAWLDLIALALISISILGTPVVVATSYLGLRGNQAPPLYRGGWLNRSMVLNACLGGGALMVAIALRARSLSMLLPPIVYTVAAVLLCIRVELLRNVQVRLRGLQLFSRCTAAGLISLSALLVIGYARHIRVRSSFGLMAIGDLGTLIMVLGVLFAFANLRLADLIVKRALRIGLLGGASLLICVVMTLLSRWRTPQESMVGQASLGIALLALIALAISLAPAAVRTLDAWIDRWLFEQPDFDLAIADLWRDLLEREKAEDVYRSAEHTIRTTLALSAVRIISAEDVPSAEALAQITGPGAYFLQPGSDLSRLLSASADVLLPLYVEDVAERWIVLARGLFRPPITAMELRFVERVAGQVQIRLSTLIGEHRRLESREREQAFREELTHAELRALRAQIDPHFLFNSLNTIAELTVTAPQRAEEMTLRLSAVFRYVLVNTDRQFTSVKEELDFSRSYLDIEEARFERRLKVLFDVDPLVLEERVPTLLLQPLIENALKHGIGQKRSGGTLTIAAKSTANGFVLTVSDDGRGLAPGAHVLSPNGTRVGIANVKKRLRTAYNDLASFTLRPLGGGGAQAVVEIRRVSVKVP